ncbi:MAG: DUF502 domain-containing protein [Bacteroidales bacterium]|nr:DUF502 domain-containing protein [Bacteroidales bacterium]MCF8343466.1 DUF502 domain-containing protein [Bacteroidales bacterium]MCF8352281.1 DUF502 domain-containing protein [Bacteroidales bacterium]MCF8375672.1 DUF502 domain-containing protein [Bacteroidales bacterium]MCF8401470.1 DUF502 domain-containing protein [Bacteroidales bacterium]
MKSRFALGHIFRWFMQGLIIIAPLTITLYILYLIFNYVDGILEKQLTQLLGVGIPGLGIIVIFIGLTIIGYLGSTILFRPIVRYFDKLISKTPLIKIIYTSLKDFFSAFVGQKKRFNEPVLIRINKDTELQKIGFVTNHDLTLLGIAGEMVAVYLPHSYNFSGNLFVVPAERVTKLNAKPADVMKFVISAGITDIETKEEK